MSHDHDHAEHAGGLLASPAPSDFRGLVAPGDDSGGFAGHSTSGLAFLLLGTWCAYNTSVLWWRAGAAGRPFHTRASYQQGWRLPWESVVKIGVSLAYGTGEVLTGCCDGGSFLNNGQHITMCGLFIMNGLADLLVFYRVPVPHHIQYLTASCAFWGESFLFTNHTHGMSPLFMHTHTFLYLPSYAAAAFLLAEAAMPSVWLLPAVRNLAIGLHGSWLVQSAFILYSPQVSLPAWTEDSSLMLLPMLFTWHLIGNLALQGGLLLLTRRGALGPPGPGRQDYSRLLLEALSDSEEEREPTGREGPGSKRNIAAAP